MMKFAVLPLTAAAVFTPQGDRHEACVVEVPETAVMEATATGIVLHHADGRDEHIETPAHCHEDQVALNLASGEQPNQWIDEAGFTYNSGFSKMTGYNNIPDAPEQPPGTDYWFLGMQNMQGGPVSILQPVLTYQESWTAASWACCPSNITTTGPTIDGAKEGDRMYGSMIRTASDTWQIITQFNGQTSTLNAQVGPWAYTWAVATFEDYGVSQCSQLPQKAVTFDTVMLYDDSGNVVHPTWNPSGATMCNGKTTIVDENTISIQHGGADVKKYYKGFKRGVHNGDVRVAEITDEMRAAAPSSLDWTTKGATTPVKNQGQCGSCWAYSATETIESGLFMNTGHIMELSEQQIVSCDRTDGGCNGGWPHSAYKYVESSGGIDTEADYPDSSSTSGQSGYCQSFTPKVQVTGYQYAVPPCESGSCRNQDEDGLKAALAAHGPISVCVNAGAWSSYAGGILSEECSGAASQLDHCVQLVGYGEDGGQAYWKVRNSWADSWGEGGYIRLPFGVNSCGIADEATFVTASTVSVTV